MSRRAAIFSQADAERALRAARNVAPGPWRLRISPQGEIIVEPAPLTVSELPPLSTDEDGPEQGRGLPVVM